MSPPSPTGRPPRPTRPVAHAAVRRGPPRARPGRPIRVRPTRRAWPWLLLALALLVLLLLGRCACAPPPPPPPALAPPPAAPTGPAAATGPSHGSPTPPPQRLAPSTRPDLVAAPSPPPSWLPAFHQQVAARAPRLAACFVGASTPGALRWTTSVDLSTGRVGDHQLSPTLDGPGLTAAQQSCVLAALSEPPYRLAAEGQAAEGQTAQGLPVPVGLVIEF